MWYLRYEVNIIFQFSEEVTLELVQVDNRLTTGDLKNHEKRPERLLTI